MLRFASRETHGNQGRQTFCPPTFIFTFGSFLTHKKKKELYLSSAGFDRRQSSRLNFTKSVSKVGKGEGRWAGEKKAGRKKEKEVKEGRAREGWRRGECVRRWVCIIMAASLFPPRRGKHLMKCKWRSWFQIDFWSPLQAGGPISTAEWFDRWFRRPINELPRHRNIKDERLFTKCHTLSSSTLGCS